MELDAVLRAQPAANASANIVFPDIEDMDAVVDNALFADKLMAAAARIKVGWPGR